MISKQKEIFSKLAGARLEEINELDKRVDSNKLIYRYKGLAADVKFGEFYNALNLFNKIREGQINLTETKSNQKRFKSNLGEINKFFNDYSSMIH